MKFKRVYKQRTDKVKDAMNSVPWGDREAMVDAIVAAIDDGGLFVLDVDIVPNSIGEAAHIILPAATSGKINLTSMNGERRMRLIEKYMDPPGQAKGDALIAARLVNHRERVLREAGDDATADNFQGFDWQTEEDAFMDGYHANAASGAFVTYERMREMGTIGFQEPATGYENGRIVVTRRLYADARFGTDDGRALFCVAEWTSLQADGKEEQRRQFPYLTKNGRANLVWQSAYLDKDNDLVMDRWPYPYIEMHPDDMAEIGAGAGDLVEVYNDVGSTQAMVQPTQTVRPGETFMLFGYPSGIQGNVVNAGVNELILPNNTQTWANIRKPSDAPDAVSGPSFKSREYRL